jgi:hypothetical protein
MIKYLQQNYTLYAEYYITQLDIDTIFPESKAYTSPIYLGEDYMRTSPYINSSSTTSAPLVATYIAVGNETTFIINALVGKTTILAFRSGLQKNITTNPTTDTNYLTITNGTITLPVGDIAMVGELFTFIYR